MIRTCNKQIRHNQNDYERYNLVATIFRYIYHGRSTELELKMGVRLSVSAQGVWSAIQRGLNFRRLDLGAYIH